VCVRVCVCGVCVCVVCSVVWCGVCVCVWGHCRTYSSAWNESDGSRSVAIDIPAVTKGWAPGFCSSERLAD